MSLELVVELDPAELACRIAEAFSEMKRPIGLTAVEALKAMDAEVAEANLRAAHAAMIYLRERVNSGKKPS